VNALQTLWTEVLATALADAGVAVCAVSPGSRSAPLVTALARSRRFELPVIIDERAAAFFALAAARSSGRPVALLCTSGSAPGHYLPAVIEAAMANVPLVVISADRPPELHDAGAAQTIPQLLLFAEQARARVDLGPPTGEPLALRAVRRRVMQAVAAAQGPVPGPVHLNVPLRKPLEPAAPSTDAERALAIEVARLAAQPPLVRPPLLRASDEGLDELAAQLLAEPRGVIVAGALPEAFAAARDDVFALAAHLGYPLLAETGSQLRLGPRPAGVTAVDQADLVLASRLAGATPPRLLLQLGAEPVAPGWQVAQPLFSGCARWALALRWQDPTSTARVVLGDPADALRRLRQRVCAQAAAVEPAFAAGYAEAEARAAAAMQTALRQHAEAGGPNSEVAMLEAALAACVQLAAAAPLAAALARSPAPAAPASPGASDPSAAPPASSSDGALPPRIPRLLLGNSLPVRVMELLSVRNPDEMTAPFLPVVTQRGASGIDGQLAAAAGAALDGTPVLALIGDVTFAHDAGSLQLLAQARSPIALVVIDNGGGRIFDHLPVARAELGDDTYPRFFTTPPRLDPVAIARSFGLRAHRADTSSALSESIVAALRTAGATLIHVPVAADGALAVRGAALRGVALPPVPLAAPSLRMVQGATS
jgi:2-succinyl-5-enolpyruvyl-6-hydroxy-3-cyclohexene-1-carboxylate synthase